MRSRNQSTRLDLLARLGIAPRGIPKAAAAAYVGVGLTKFGEMVDDGRMPKPREIDGVQVWDIRELDEAFDRLPHAGDDQESSTGSSVWSRAQA